MRTRRSRLVAVAATLATAVVPVVAASGTARAVPPPPPGPPHVTVMTQNLYLGANLTPLFTPGGDFAQKAAAVLAHVKQVDFPARAGRIADEIKARHPDLVGLQEVALWQTGTSPTCEGLTDYENYLDDLKSALKARGLHYTVASSDLNFNLAAPLVGFGCASFADSDVILARTDGPAAGMVVGNAQSHEFKDYPGVDFPSPVPGFTCRNEMPIAVLVPVVGLVPICIDRGWTSVDVTKAGRSFRFIDTHLEAYGPEAPNEALFRNTQASVLAQAVIGTSDLPVIAVGDFNSRAAPVPDSNGAYGMLLAAGLTDAWPLVARHHDPGWSSGQEDDLTNVPSKTDHRIDLVLFSSGPLKAKHHSGFIVGDTHKTNIGALHHVMAYSTKVEGGQWLWPSDHAGVVATLKLGKP